MGTPKKTTKMSPEQEYKKEVKRIQQFIKRASKRGFIWETSPIPKQPKTITTKSVARLKRITPDTLYKKGIYVDQETGEILSGTKGRNLEQKIAAEKAKKSRQAKKAKQKNKKDKTKDELDNRKRNKDNASKPKEKSKPKQDKDSTKSDTKQDTKSSDYYPTFTDIVLSNFHAQLMQFPNAEGVPLLLAWFDKLIEDNGKEAVAQMLQDGADQGIILTWETVYKAVNTKTYMTEMMNHLPDQGKIYSEQIMDMMEQFEWWESPE